MLVGLLMRELRVISMGGLIHACGDLYFVIFLMEAQNSTVYVLLLLLCFLDVKVYVCYI